MARQPRGNAQDPARKRRLDEFDRRLTAVEGQVRTHEDRMENLEYRFELETSYRYIRIENSPGLDQMFKDLAAKTMENSEIRERTGQVLMREIREVLEREVDEGQLQATSQTNNARRKWHPPAVRKATLDALNVKVKAAKARARGKAKPEETRRVRIHSNGGRIQAGCCKTTNIFSFFGVALPERRN